MAEPVTPLASWQGEGVRVGEVLGALDRLRRVEQQSATRTAVMTLVAVAEDDAAAAVATAALAGLGGRHPARSVLIVRGSVSGPSRLCDASVEVLGSHVAGHDVLSEHVVLRASGPILGHLDSLVEPLTLADLPVAVWYVASVPPVGEPLLGAADALLVDSRQVGDAAAFPGLVELARRHNVVDLSWARLEPWRQLLAGLFEGREFRPFAGCVRHAAVAGKEGPRHLLAGWLASRLGLARAAFRLEAARHVSIVLTCEGARFTVERREGERVVRASASVEGGPSHEDVVALPDESLPWSLAEALTHLERDRVYEQSLRGALAFAAP